MENIFDRTEMLLGEENLMKLHGSKVLVLGVGGVGSYVVEALARTGVGHLVLCDHDDIAISNLNRQVHTTMETLGMIKAEVMAARIKTINPDIKVTVHPMLYMRETAEEIVTEDLDYVVDAIDMVSSKLHLAEFCQSKGIPLMASMGTGNKMNPMMLEVADIYDTSVCPLAKVMRRELKKRGVHHLKVVYSKEQPLKPHAIKTDESPQDETGFKRRGTPGSIAFVPSVAGLIIASEVVKDLISWQSN